MSLAASTAQSAWQSDKTVEPSENKPAAGEPAAGASHEPCQYIRGQGAVAISAAG
jgi:hypothetical protein